MWIDIRSPQSGQLLFKYDPVKNRVQIKADRELVEVDLEDYRDHQKDFPLPPNIDEPLDK